MTKSPSVSELHECSSEIQLKEHSRVDKNHLLRRVKNISGVTSDANLSSRAGSSRAAREKTRARYCPAAANGPLCRQRIYAARTCKQSIK